jgi:hypothetical protein
VPPVAQDGRRAAGEPEVHPASIAVCVMGRMLGRILTAVKEAPNFSNEFTPDTFSEMAL